MFFRSTAVLRGCLHRSSPIRGRCQCGLEAPLRNYSKSPPSPPTHVSNQLDPRLLVESRVQSTRPPEAGKQRGPRKQGRLTVEAHSDQIFGHKIRHVSRRLEARKRRGPEPISDLQPVGVRGSTSSKWSFPPTWKTWSPKPDSTSSGLREMTHNKFRKSWKKNYMELYTQSRNGNLGEARTTFNADRQIAVAFVGDRSLEELRAAWTYMPQGDKQHLESIMLGCLVDSARRTLLMLSLDIIFPRDWRLRCECLCYLDMAYRDEIDADSYLKELFAQQVEQVSRIWAWPDPSMGAMPWHFLVLLLRHNNPEHCENIIDTVLEDFQSVDSRLILVMVDHFTKLGDADRALNLLSRIPPEQREEHKVRILERCANLISIDTIEKSDSVGNFRALPALIGLGLPIDYKIHNRILERALELGVPEVAWEVFRFMETRDIQVDARNHLLLLQDSFERNDRDKLDAMMSAIHGREDLYQYPYLVTYIMHIVRVVCTIDRNLPPETSVSHLLAIYDRTYDRAPLVKLGIINALPSDHSVRRKLGQPPPAVLGFTIWAYVLCQRDERLVSALWFWIIHMIKQQDESVLACAQHDIMWNGFIHFYARSRFYLRKAVDVVEVMIERNLCMPTERTWSELLCGFMKHGEEETAAKIWSMMLARNVQPTEKGWAFLLEKYDETQLSELVKYVLDERRMPEVMSTTLGWRRGNTTDTEDVATAATDAHPAIQLTSEDIAVDEMFEGEEHEDSDEDPALPSANVYQ